MTQVAKTKFKIPSTKLFPHEKNEIRAPIDYSTESFQCFFTDKDFVLS